MSSAEDAALSAVSPPAGASNSTPEEFAVEPHPQGENKANEPDSAARPSEAPSQVALSLGASHESSPPEPDLGEDAIPLKTKPLPKVNAAAREMRVRVTGARAGNVAGERELFSEAATTVLVLEKGAVIRLTAAVSPGQLLFLSNEESKREVVTQVTRKRVYRPTECYVELEFTEPAPGFWGLEFSAATPLLPKDAKEIAAVELVASAETTADEPDVAAAPPTAEEVEALRKEISALRSQLDLLQTQTEPRQTEPMGTTPSMPPAMPADAGTPQVAPPSYQTEKISWTEIAAETHPIEQEPKPRRAIALDQALPPKPALDFHVPVPKRKRSFRAHGQFTPGFRTGMLRLAVLSCVLAALIGTAWFRHWLPWAQEAKKIPVSSLNGVTTAVSLPTVRRPGPLAVEPESAKTNSGNSAPVSMKETSNGAALSSDTPVEAVAPNRNGTGSSLPAEVMRKPVAREKKEPLASMAQPSVHTLPAKVVDSSPAADPNATLVPPKLIQSEPAVASLDDLRDFETGSVLIDALIDTAGNVQYMNVLKGPPSLRGPALQALRNYKYLPAMQNGKPVVAHVTVKIQFRFVE